jgi:hypothetical protein
MASRNSLKAHKKDELPANRGLGFRPDNASQILREFR